MTTGKVVLIRVHLGDVRLILLPSLTVGLLTRVSHPKQDRHAPVIRVAGDDVHLAVLIDVADRKSPGSGGGDVRRARRWPKVARAVAEHNAHAVAAGGDDI